MRRPDARILLEAVTFRSGHGLLKACGEDVGWRNEGKPCAAPEWTPAHHVQVSHTQGEQVELTLALADPGAEGPIEIRGEGPQGLRFEGEEAHPAARVAIDLGSAAPLERKVARLAFDVTWSAGEGEAPLARGGPRTSSTSRPAGPATISRTSGPRTA